MKQPSNPTLDILCKLIGFPTVSRDSNLGLIEWARDYLKQVGVSSELIYDAKKTKANLWATIGPVGNDGIILSGHTDVVPVSGQAWDSDPFQAQVRDGRLYGRGACDMKAFVAAVLAQVPHWVDRPLKRPIHLAFSYDEETGCLGVRSLIAYLQERSLTASGCIVGEPTQMQPVVAHKGRLCIHGTVRGRAAHSSLTPQSVNAIEYAARLICFVRKLADSEAAQGLRETGFDVPFSTLATTLIKGGLSSNIIPERCEFSFDYRYLPLIDPTKLLEAINDFKDQLVNEMKVTAMEGDIILSQESSVLALNSEECAPFTLLVKALTQGEQLKKVGYGSEGGFYDRIGIPTVVCGPGSIEQAHRANEFVQISQLESCDAFLRLIGEKLC